MTIELNMIRYSCYLSLAVKLQHIISVHVGQAANRAASYQRLAGRARIKQWTLSWTGNFMFTSCMNKAKVCVCACV